MIESEAYVNGRDAGFDRYLADDNPYGDGTFDYDEWEDGRLSSIGERREQMPNAKLRGAADET
jgi:hypothetical protein